MTQGKKHVVIAGGGTGGHLFPGIAIAAEFQKQGTDHRVMFISTGNPFEKRTLKKNGLRLMQITASGLKGMGAKARLEALMRLPKGVIEAARILRRFRADIVVGVGGYASGPTLIAAVLMRIPVVLQEQNSIPGITNRVFALFARKVYLSYGKSARFFKLSKTRLTGNPIRQGIIDQMKGMDANSDKNKGEKGFNLLILGGSQGAHAINQAVLAAIKEMQIKEGVIFIHQTGEKDLKVVADAYAELHQDAIVKPFFDDMAKLYQKSDLIIARAGATTIAEVSAIGRPVIFIPFPYAADDHQTENANLLAAKGAAEVITEKVLTGKKLAERIVYHMTYPAYGRAMGRKLRKTGRPHAAQEIVRDCIRLLHANSIKRSGESIH